MKIPVTATDTAIKQLKSEGPVFLATAIYSADEAFYGHGMARDYLIPINCTVTTDYWPSFDLMQMLETHGFNLRFSSTCLRILSRIHALISAGIEESLFHQILFTQ